jgi:hypothetical protein
MARVLVEIGEVFQDCLRQKAAQGIPPEQAKQVCSEPSSFQWPGTMARPAATEAPESPPPPREGKATPKTGKSLRKAVEQLGVAIGGGSRWGGRDLTPGFVPYGPDPRTEAHIWAKEMVRVGQRPPFQLEAWAEHARRMGLDPKQAAKGWSYIEKVFSKRYERSPAEKAREVLGEFATNKWSGYYMQPPHEFKVRMQGSQPKSWPWATKEAEAVYEAAKKFIAAHPDASIEQAFEVGLAKAKVSMFELTPEDDAIMGIALQWEIQGKEAQPEPPEIPTNRTAGGTKGRQIAGSGHLLNPMGSP